MSVRLRIASRTDVGRVRSGNEDAFLVADDVRLVAVADGMGGHQAGEVASATAITALLDGLQQGESIADAITGANDAVWTKAAEDPALRGMGTTLTAGVIDDTSLVIGHVGDSRAYRLRAGELRQVTTDHSVIAELMAAGELTEAEALVDPRRAMITRALGIDPTVTVDVLTVDLEPGDRLLLCSDGLTTMVRDDRIEDILATEADPGGAADALVAAANAAGGADNITVVVADVVAADDPDATPPELPVASAPAAPPEAIEDTEQVPVVDADALADADAADPPDEITAESGGDDVAAETDDEADEAAAGAAPRRRWWQRRPRP
ncbi:MAG: Stp1/IreP family PP2C-type Ser/Thr phosphatase [Acidimicrobiia bacterium]|jgi:protein phosphatase